MEEKQNKQYRKSDIHKTPYDIFMVDYLKRELHINPRRNFLCLNPEHKEDQASMGFDRKNNVCHCFGCNKRYAIADLVMLKEGCSYEDAILKLKDMYGKVDVNDPALKKIYEEHEATPTNKSVEFLNKISNNYTASDKTIDFLKKARGFKHAREIAEYDTIYEYQGNYFVPHKHCVAGGGFEITDYLIRYSDPKAMSKYSRSKGTGITYFECGIPPYFTGGADMFKMFGVPENKKIVCFISEGEFDALSYQDLYYDDKKKYSENGLLFSSIASSSTSNIWKVKQAILDLDPIIRKNTIFVLGCDNDDAGKKANNSYEHFFFKHHLCYVKNTLFNGYKDINDRLQADRENLLKEFSELTGKLKNEFYRQKVNNVLANLKNKGVVYEEYSDTGSIILPFVHAIAYEVETDAKTGNIKPKMIEEKFPEKRMFYNALSANKIDDFEALAEDVKRKYFEEYKPTGNVQIYLNTGVSTVQKMYSKHLEQIIQNMSEDYVFMDDVDNKKFLDEYYGTFDEGNKKSSLIEICDNTKKTIVKMFTQGETIKYYSKFENQIDDVLKGYDSTGDMDFEICKTTNVLKDIGVRNKEFVLGRKTFNNAIKNELISLETIKKTPDTFFDPLFIFDSKENKNDIYLVSKTIENDENVLLYKINNSKELSFVGITKTNIDELGNIFKNALEDERLLYVDNSEGDLRVLYGIDLPNNLLNKKEDILLKKSQNLGIEGNNSIHKENDIQSTTEEETVEERRS